MSTVNKSDLILDELKRRRQREVVDVEEEKVKIVIFSLLDDCFAFYGSDIKEILPPQTIYFVPGAPDFIMGVINNRGDVESVININRFLGFPDPEMGPQSRIALAYGAGIRSGILVDSILDVMDVPISLISPPLSTLDEGKREFVTGEMAYGNKNVTVLSVGKIFEKVK
ncbi:MAG: chemotaxis protein CheW [Thermodesulfovibrionales bacterium]|nr:chemotaxis protein CheW [Thermodesulfovibrionales bacterium]